MRGRNWCHDYVIDLVVCFWLCRWGPPVCPFVDHKAGWTFLMSLKVHSLESNVAAGAVGYFLRESIIYKFRYSSNSSINIWWRFCPTFSDTAGFFPLLCWTTVLGYCVFLMFWRTVYYWLLLWVIVEAWALPQYCWNWLVKLKLMMMFEDFMLMNTFWSRRSDCWRFCSFLL